MQNMSNRGRRARFAALLLPLLLTACIGPLRPPERITPPPSPEPSQTLRPMVTPAVQTASPTPSPAPPTPSPSPAPTPPKEIILSFIGDCTLGGDPALGQLDAFTRVLNANGGDMGYFFKNALPFLENDALTVVNLEGPLTDRETGAEKQFAFRGDPSFAEILKSGNIEAVTLANNHTLDFGEEGYHDTLVALEMANVRAVDVGRPLAYETEGGKIGVASAKFLTRARMAQLRDDIDQLKNDGCAVIVALIHWGVEGAEFPDAPQQEYARAIIDAGADLVVGHHPHILQGIEVYNGRVIAYSLGNFVFGGNRKPSERETAILQQRYIVTEQGLEPAGFRVVPFLMTAAAGNDYQPVYLEDGGSVFEIINRRSELLSGGVTVTQGWQLP